MTAQCVQGGCIWARVWQRNASKEAASGRERDSAMRPKRLHLGRERDSAMCPKRLHLGESMTAQCVQRGCIWAESMAAQCVQRGCICAKEQSPLPLSGEMGQREERKLWSPGLFKPSSVMTPSSSSVRHWQSPDSGRIYPSNCLKSSTNKL